MLGLLPMSGMAERWNGTYKELLPVEENKWLCDYALDAFAYVGVRDIVIISYPDKIATHVQHFKKEKYKQFNISYVMRQGVEMWDALMSAMHISALYERTLFAMPDTVIPENSFSIAPYWTINDTITFGIFMTSEPERFSVFDNNKIVCKSPKLQGQTKHAWGVVTWSKELALSWKDMYSFYHYDDAFNHGIEFFNYSVYKLDHYRDIQNWQAYKEFLCTK